MRGGGAEEEGRERDAEWERAGTGEDGAGEGGDGYVKDARCKGLLGGEERFHAGCKLRSASAVKDKGYRAGCKD